MASNRKAVSDIKVRDCVEFTSPRGQVLTGQAVMRSPAGGWIVNTGGKYGTTRLVSDQNYVRHITLDEHNKRIAGRSEVDHE